MRVRGVDTETEAFSAGDMAPRLVCVQDTVVGESPPRVTLRTRGAIPLVASWLDAGETIVGHNIAYDAAVLCREGLLPQVFRAYQEGRVLCTWVYERLGEIVGFSSRKNLDLATVCQAHGIPAPGMKGDEAVTRTFGQFINATELPDPWREYALGDCIVAKVFERQHARFAARVPFKTLQLLSYRSFCLQLSSVWGLPVDTGAVAALERTAMAELERIVPGASAAGFLRWGKCTRRGVRTEAWVKQVKALRAAVTEAYDGNPPMTQRSRKASAKWQPQVATDRETLVSSGDPDLENFAAFGEWSAVANKDLPMFRESGGLIHTRYGITDTCRTSSAKPAIQNWKTGIGGNGPAIRECVVAPPGKAIISIDYAGLELASFAQNVATQLGHRRMAADLNSGIDLHSRLGAALRGVPYDDFVAAYKAGDPALYWYRQVGKGNNFGRQGGMGAPEGASLKRQQAAAAKFARYCATQYHTAITVEQAIESERVWRQLSPDGVAWLQHVSSTEKADGTFDAYLPGFDITRRNLWYCAACNNPFQSQGAYVCTQATIALTEAMYLPGGPLAHARCIAHIHDEWLIECPVESVAETDHVARDILINVARLCMPDVTSCVPEAKAMRNWTKRAKELRGPDGGLQIWIP